MNPSLAYLASAFERMEQVDVLAAPGFRFMKALRTKLLSKVGCTLSEQAIDEIIANMTIELGNPGSDGDDDEFIDRVSTSMTNLIVKLHDGYKAVGFIDPDKALITLARQLSIKVG